MAAPKNNPVIWPQRFSSEAAARKAWRDSRQGGAARFVRSGASTVIVQGDVSQAMATKMVTGLMGGGGAPRGENPGGDLTTALERAEDRAKAQWVKEGKPEEREYSAKLKQLDKAVVRAKGRRDDQARLRNPKVDRNSTAFKAGAAAGRNHGGSKGQGRPSASLVGKWFSEWRGKTKGASFSDRKSFDAGVANVQNPNLSGLRTAAKPVFAARQVEAQKRFLGTIQERGGLSAGQAKKAFDTLKRVKALNYDGVNGVYSVKHGAFLDKDVLERAAKGVKNPLVGSKKNATTLRQRPGKKDEYYFDYDGKAFGPYDTLAERETARKKYLGIKQSKADAFMAKYRMKKNGSGRNAKKGVAPIASITHGSKRADVFTEGKKFAVAIAGLPRELFDSLVAATKYARVKLAEVANQPARIAAGSSKSVRKLLSKNPGRRNPQAEAAESYEMFHGLPSTQVIEYRTREHIHEHLWAAGTLCSMVVKGPRGGELTLRAPDPDKVDFTHVVMTSLNELGNQIYFMGGDQSLPLDQIVEAFAMNDDDIRDHMEIGRIKRLTYRTFKNFEERGEVPIDFYHDHGKEDAEGVLPLLCYRPLDSTMFIVGGRYKVAPRDRTLKASPGIVG